MKHASHKQIGFGHDIAYVLNIEQPKEQTSQAYYLFIQANIEQYKKAIKENPYKLIGAIQDRKISEKAHRLEGTEMYAEDVFEVWDEKIIV